MVVINDVPQEVLEYILYFVSPYDDLKSCRLVCHRWYLSCLGVVKKRKYRFGQALKSGFIEWFSPSIANNPNTITRRYSHSACIYDSYMYVFGGCTATNTTFNDLWKFHLGTNVWTRLLTTGTYPSPKAYASMTACNSSLVLFGGWTHPSVYPLHQQWVLFNELHIYDILANRWTQLYFEGFPPPTAGHTSSVHEEVVVVFGGLQKQEGLSTSTNDIYCLDLRKGRWFKPKVSSEMPQPRYGHSQIKLDERHIMVMAGCGGSNKLYSDVWLLTLPQEFNDYSDHEWKWELITVEGIDHMPSQMWYNPACKVGDYVAILSKWHSQGTGTGTTSGKMHQLFVPGTGVRRQSANMWVAPINQHPPENHHLENINVVNQELNVNGQRGTLRIVVPAGEPSTSSSDESNDNSNSRARSRPSIRPNASSDRERRLQILSRMEERIRTRMISRPQNVVESCKINKSILVPHFLDIRRVLSCKIVTWLPVSVDKDGNPPYLGIPPQPCLLYTLLMGRGHMVMFGGIPNDPIDSQNQEAVSNVVTFISAPSSKYVDLL